MTYSYTLHSDPRNLELSSHFDSHRASVIMSIPSIISGSSFANNLLATIMMEENFRPHDPLTIADTGIPHTLIDSLILKRLLVSGQNSGRQLANEICINFNIVEELLRHLRVRQMIVHRGAAPLNDYYYSLSEAGQERAHQYMRQCAYVGPAPVTLTDYILSVEAQSIRNERPKAVQLRKAFRDISINESLYDDLGPAINSGAGMFLYGEPGNGKSTIAQRITQCFSQEVWIPHAIYEDGQIIKLYDAAYHRAAAEQGDTSLELENYDRRWVRIKRPTVIVGGELTIDSLEIRFDANSKISEAPLQMKSNCGSLLIDDFGRQRIEPRELLNRWIIPLENRIDFLTLSTGKKIQVPFEQLIIFSTNLKPHDLVDEAFLRRIPYKIYMKDPTVEEFHRLFKLYCEKVEIEYNPVVVNYIIEKYYIGQNRRLRRCQPRDILWQVGNFCHYFDLKPELREDYIDRIMASYLTPVLES